MTSIKIFTMLTKEVNWTDTAIARNHHVMLAKLYKS